jgi:hypothetical protein
MKFCALGGLCGAVLVADKAVLRSFVECFDLIQKIAFLQR